MELVTSSDQIIKNLFIFDGYQRSDKEFHREFFNDRLRLGKIFVYGVFEGRFVFAPSRFAGYIGCTAEKHSAFPEKNGSLTTPAISKCLGSPINDVNAERAYSELCQKLGITPSDKDRTYWPVRLNADLSTEVVRGGEDGFANEVGTFVEGATKRVIVNAYERNVGARQACLEHYGYGCVVCKFDFAVRFGDIGKGFMHVHHLTPISSGGKPREVDPIKELRPVCPNCHAMLHKSDPPFTIEELKKLIQAADANRMESKQS